CGPARAPSYLLPLHDALPISCLSLRLSGAKSASAVRACSCKSATLENSTDPAPGILTSASTSTSGAVSSVDGTVGPDQALRASADDARSSNAASVAARCLPYAPVVCAPAPAGRPSLSLSETSESSLIESLSEGP